MSVKESMGLLIRVERVKAYTTADEFETRPWLVAALPAHIAARPLCRVGRPSTLDPGRSVPRVPIPRAPVQKDRRSRHAPVRSARGVCARYCGGKWGFPSQP